MRRHCFTFLASTILSFGLGQIANAADMPIKAPRMPIAVSYNWTGFYVGANGGYGWGYSNWMDDPALGGSALGSHPTGGGLVGGQIGFNWQFSEWVAGVEADIDWANLTGSHIDPALHDIHTKTTAVGTIAARFGYTWDRSLAYFKGGAAWGRFSYDDFVTLGGALNGSGSSTSWGYTLGGGYEYAFAPNWSAKIEYSYMDFGSRNVSFNGGVAGAYVQGITDRVQAVKVGVNYRFR